MIPREGQFLMLKELAMILRGARVMMFKEDLFMMHRGQVDMMHSQEGLLVLMDMLRQ